MQDEFSVPKLFCCYVLYTPQVEFLSVIVTTGTFGGTDAVRQNEMSQDLRHLTSHVGILEPLFRLSTRTSVDPTRDLL
jgi:hypothetical protein